MIEYINPLKAMNLHWYVQVKKRESGPYSYVELLSMIHNEDILPDDQVTYRGLGDWHSVAQFQNFTPEQILKTLDENDIDPEDSSDMPFRRSIRIPVKSEVLAIVDGFYFKCECIDLSAGGCLIKIPRGKIKQDHPLKIHFYRDEKSNLLPFNAKGESVRVVSAEKLKEGSNYYDLVGVKFDKLKKTERETLQAKLREIVFTTMTDEDIDKVLNRGQALSA